MTLTVREVYEWHMENARECIGRSVHGVAVAEVSQTDS